MAASTASWMVSWSPGTERVPGSPPAGSSSAVSSESPQAVAIRASAATMAMSAVSSRAHVVCHSPPVCGSWIRPLTASSAPPAHAATAFVADRCTGAAPAAGAHRRWQTTGRLWLMRDWVVGGAVIEAATLIGAVSADVAEDSVLLVENRRHNGQTDWTPPGG